MNPYPLRIPLLIGALFLGLAGCGGPKTGTVQGKVTLEGAPITFGTIAFIGNDGRVESTMIKPDATYEAVKAPVGDAVITVQTYPLPPQVHPPDKPPPPGPPPVGEARYTPIPPSYADAKGTPLRLTVKQGTQTHNLELTKKGR